jgi:hypothetical protein
MIKCILKYIFYISYSLIVGLILFVLSNWITTASDSYIKLSNNCGFWEYGVGRQKALSLEPGTINAVFDNAVFNKNGDIIYGYFITWPDNTVYQERAGKENGGGTGYIEGYTIINTKERMYIDRLSREEWEMQLNKKNINNFELKEYY